MKRVLTPLISIAAVPSVHAHCPLCTVGAAAAAGGAAYLGMNQIGIGLFIGAFAASMGWWFSRLIKREFVRFQKDLLVWVSWALTIFPMLMVMDGVIPLYLGWWGPFGRTIVLNQFLIGSLIGAGTLYLTPWLSRQLSEWRGTQIPFQGVALTFAVLIVLAAIVQVMV